MIDIEASFLPSYWIRALICCAAIAILAHAAHTFHLDDALIYARYIDNALQGKGLVFNPGDSVNALTSLLDTWLQLAGASLVGGHVLTVQFTLGIALFTTSVLVAEAVVPFAGLTIATSQLFYRSFGMETSLFIVCLVVTVGAFVKGRINWLPTLCLLCCLTRFEGGALALFIGARLWQRRQIPSIIAFVPPALLIGLYLAFNMHFYHQLLPQSATAKFGQGRSGFWGEWPHAFLQFPATVTEPWGTKASYFPCLGVFAFFGARRAGFEKLNSVVVPFLILLALFYVFFNIPAYFWYYAPFVYFLTIYACRLIPKTRAAFVAVMLLFGIAVHASCARLREPDSQSMAYQEAGRWIREHTPAEARIATAETGTIGLTCDRYVIDLVGLTTPKNAEYTARRDFSSWINEDPDYVIVHVNNPFPWEAAALHSPKYELMPMRFGPEKTIGIMKRRVEHGLS